MRSVLYARTYKLILCSQTQSLNNGKVLFHSSGERYKNTPLKWSYASGPGTKSLLNMTIGQVAQRAADLFGDEEALVSCHQGITKTFTQVNEEADQLAAGFLAMGFEPGDRIGIWGPNSYEWYLTEFAAAKAGLILVNINPGYRPAELKFCLNKVAVKGIVCAEQFKTSNYYKLLSEVAPEVSSATPGQLQSKEIPNLKTVITMADSPLSGAFNFKELFNAGGSDEMNKVNELETKCQFDDPCNIQFTSGTTGLPKAAVLSHHNIVNNAYLTAGRCEYDKQKEVICLSVPLFHCFGCVMGILGSALYGCSTVLPSAGFDAQAIVKSFQKQKITSCYGTPTMFTDILNEYKKNPVNVDQLHTGIMAGAPCPEELVTAIMQELNMKDLMVMYGMTETSPVTFQCFPTDSPKIRSSTIGYPSDHTEVKVVDDQGLVVPIGSSGELCIRGYTVFLGYWGDEQKTKETIGQDRWLKTGDLVTMNSEGYASVIGRIKDMIIRGGENIYPAEIENFFMGHDDIVEAQVFGVPDERLGEQLAMWIRRTEDSYLTDQSIREWAKDKISHFKIPKYILFKTDFPRTISGKIQKFKMQQETVAELCL